MGILWDAGGAFGGCGSDLADCLQAGRSVYCLAEGNLKRDYAGMLYDGVLQPGKACVPYYGASGRMHSDPVVGDAGSMPGVCGYQGIERSETSAASVLLPEIYL